MIFTFISISTTFNCMSFTNCEKMLYYNVITISNNCYNDEVSNMSMLYDLVVKLLQPMSTSHKLNNNLLSQSRKFGKHEIFYK